MLLIKNTYFHIIDWERKEDGSYIAKCLSISAADLLYNKFIDYLRARQVWNDKTFLNRNVIQGKRYEYKQWAVCYLEYNKRQPFMNKEALPN